MLLIVSLCPKNCSKNGVCVAGQCACYAGWAGRLCQHPACENECYYHGECKQGVCECDVGYHGRDCSQRHVENGLCNLKTGECKCDSVDNATAAYPVREVFVVHVGGPRCVTASTDNIRTIQARITLHVECIRRACIFIF